MRGRSFAAAPAVLLAFLLAVTGAGVARGQGVSRPLADDPWKLLESGQAQAASELFRQAIATTPRDARLHLGAGVAAYLLRRDEEARAALERTLQLNPALGLARELLGLVLYRGGQLDAAVAAYETLLAAAPDQPAIADRLARWRREVELRDRMTMTVGSGFTLSFEGPPDGEIASRAMASLERAALRIGQALSAYPLAPIPVVLYSSEEFRDITRAPEWAGGAFDGIIRVPVRDALANDAELDRVLAHEFTHALIRSLAPRGVPTWLDEGLASAFERDGASERSEAVPGGPGIPLRELEGSFTRFTAERATAAYATSMRAARRLLDEAGGFAVANLLRDLGAGVPFEQAFARRIQVPLAEFESSFAAGR